MALPHLSPTDLHLLASDTQPLLSALPHRPRLGPRPPRPSRRTSAHRAEDRAPIVSRRMRKYHNDLRLAINAAESGCLPQTKDDMTALFQRNSTSHWSLLHQDDEKRDIWQQFIESDEAVQRQILQENEKLTLHRVNHRLRVLIKQRPCLSSLVKDLEERVIQLPVGESVLLRLPQPAKRVVAHAVAQFYRMAHHSFGVGEQRITVIRCRNPVPNGPSLLEVLAV